MQFGIFADSESNSTRFLRTLMDTLIAEGHNVVTRRLDVVVTHEMENEQDVYRAFCFNDMDILKIRGLKFNRVYLSRNTPDEFALELRTWNMSYNEALSPFIIYF